MPAQKTPFDMTPMEAVLGQFFYVVAHEMGHTMPDMLNVPLFGGAEDAADQFANHTRING